MKNKQYKRPEPIVLSILDIEEALIIFDGWDITSYDILGETVIQFHNEMEYDRAKELLRDNEIPIQNTPNNE